METEQPRVSATAADTAARPPRRRPRVRQEVVVGLARRILTGEFQPGESLPKEPDLCAQYGVSRTVIREATKILESKGLLRIRSRLGTHVLDQREWNMLDPDLLAWSGSNFYDPRFVHSLMEARHIIEPAAAELAAKRATAKDLAALEDAYRRMRAVHAYNVPEYSVADMDFHTALLAASHNHVLMHLASVIRAAMRALFELTAHLGTAPDQALDLHGEIVEAVRVRQPEAARAAIVRILDNASADLRAGQADIEP
jgi:DNA-binding FadR family transcriptional regulator